jgi:hypothetical protein
MQAPLLVNRLIEHLCRSNRCDRSQISIEEAIENCSSRAYSDLRLFMQELVRYYHFGANDALETF